ncbi:MAG TPA: glycosyltransferase family 4 protein [Geminicoccaceae bacterium]|nr:glycosyltransferase family 4 protein [Geminicoccaceae bacterium]
MSGPATDDPARLPVACVMLSAARGGLEQSLFDYCEALLVERHPVHAVIHPRWVGRAALEQLPLTTIAPLTNRNEWDPFAVGRLRNALRAAAPRLVLTIGRRASTLTRRARRRLPHLPQVGVTPNYSLGPLIGLDHVLATTLDLKDALIAAGQPPEQISVIPNLVRAPPDVAMIGPHPAGVPVIGALGRFVPKKGFADLLEALARLRDRGLRFEARLAGSGPEEAALRARAAQLKLERRVRFLGWVEDKRSFFGALDLFCVPSREEPFGIVVLEGMAHGRATIATDAPGPREIVRHGVDGLLVPSAAPDALAAALGELLVHPERRLALARAGRETVRARFDLPVVAKRISAALGQAIERRPSPDSAT